MKPGYISAIATGAILLTVGLSMTGCGTPHTPEPIVTTQEVDVPIETMVAPPKELSRAPLPASEIPQVVAPGTPGVTSCLTPAGEDKLRAAIGRDHTLLGGWDAWTAPQ